MCGWGVVDVSESQLWEGQVVAWVSRVVGSVEELCPPHIQVVFEGEHFSFFVKVREWC